MGSLSYQTVIAGRVREDEGIGFFGGNFLAVPSGSVARANLDATEQPSLTILPLFDENVGKKENRASGFSSHLGTSGDNSFA